MAIVRSMAPWSPCSCSDTLRRQQAGNVGLPHALIVPVQSEESDANPGTAARIDNHADRDAIDVESAVRQFDAQLDEFVDRRSFAAQPYEQAAKAGIEDFDALVPSPTDDLSRRRCMSSGFTTSFRGFHNWDKRRPFGNLKLRPCRFLKIRGRRVDVTKAGCSDNLI